jgi:hypothetical protein
MKPSKACLERLAGLRKWFVTTTAAAATDLIASLTSSQMAIYLWPNLLYI